MRVIKTLVYGFPSWKSLAEIAHESHVREEVAAGVLIALFEHNVLAYRIRDALLADDISSQERSALQRANLDYHNCGYFEYRIKRKNSTRRKQRELLTTKQFAPAF